MKEKDQWFSIGLDILIQVFSSCKKHTLLKLKINGKGNGQEKSFFHMVPQTAKELQY